MSGSIHIKLENPEVNDLKKRILILKKCLLENLVHAKTYGSLRKKEFTLKKQFKSDITRVVTLITEIESSMPHEEVEEILKGKKQLVSTEFKRHQTKQPSPAKKKLDLEDQIEEIKAKLAMFQ